MGYKIVISNTCIVIDNYVMIYTIIEEDRTILVSHMYYGGRNYLDGGLL